MQALAYTFWMNDLIVLDMWLKYYSKYFDKLHIMCCGTKDGYIRQLDERKLKYNLTYERLSESICNPSSANEEIKKRQVEFLNDFEWVLFSCCDEIVCADPRKYKDISKLMRKTRKRTIPCEAFEIFWQKDEPVLDYSKPLLKQRKYWVKNINYNKTILSKDPLNWNDGQHQVRNKDGNEGEKSKLFKNTGLYLLHFKWADSMDNRDLGPFKSLGGKGFLDKDKEEIPTWIKEVV
jgi:hypothetical protein